MAIETHIGVGGAYKQATEIHIGVGGVWKDCSEVHVGVGGVWKQVFQKVAITLSGQSVSEVGAGEQIAGIRINTDGTIDQRTALATYTQIDASTDWIIPNSAAADATYHVKWTPGVGDPLTTGSDSTGTWLELNTNREWFLKDTAALTHQATLAISNDGGTTTLDSATYNLLIETL